MTTKTKITDKFHIWTVGCQMNVADSQRVDVGLKRLGLDEEKNIEDADIVVLNTCVVRQSAEDTATGLLGKLAKQKKRKSTFICVTGCMVESTTKTLAERFPQVDLWAKPQDTPKIIENIADFLDLSSDGCVENLIPEKSKFTEFVPIVQGCDKFCTFCVIPYRRGRETSKPMDQIFDEIKQLVDNGTKEVTLLGQNVDSYGHDLNPKMDLSDLMHNIHDISKLLRIRFLTSHPNDMSIKLINTIKDLPKVCKCINLPFQAGSNRILANMRRGYTRDQFLRKIDQIRNIIPDVTLTTDLIVGFPGETELDFLDSINLLKEVNFDKVHVAAYSERKGTFAFRQIEDDIPQKTKRERLNEVNKLQDTVQNNLNSKYLNKFYEVLIEGKNRDKYYGRTEGDKLVYVENLNETFIGQILKTRIIDFSPYSLIAEKN
ncbi:tRNA (N6-isopentenyl adenosine(37)-C2)-methylthiotransferase MiaB [Chloroflexi bacterium]|jgi:tRNA-2-methylthio-N6-dimethylallyladenosine synthase|nr:tRNA (N6-isopentenyl adenosine(37)-C2)-methylthiotransferase MiaB [Chloroflexota bacterium]MDC0252681.1 tRNA (N6-isopentenyl adenosine(37)-C2)-methylthiotransferase MiaB [Chloroflexota bacterium]RZP12826.1 MAG: tRNA (N6-isopentenyl adenosine(37)-C2)-methylthiotransferase MiaB [Chloroflexota bacterium]|tara:strand:- start:20881 stop:22176 length:1296 start_codon:yes stop_codon:yes gene_type:complete